MVGDRRVIKRSDVQWHIGFTQPVEMVYGYDADFVLLELKPGDVLALLLGEHLTAELRAQPGGYQYWSTYRGR